MGISISMALKGFALSVVFCTAAMYHTSFIWPSRILVSCVCTRKVCAKYSLIPCSVGSFAVLVVAVHIHMVQFSIIVIHSAYILLHELTSHPHIVSIYVQHTWHRGV